MRIIFVHGAFVRDGAWWWHPVAGLLTTAGHESTAVRLPSCGEAGAEATGTGPGFAADVAATRAVLDDGGPCIVVAHSYGGMVVSAAAAAHPAVEHLVYVSSFLPHPGDSHLSHSAGGSDPVPVAVHPNGAVSVVDDERIDARFLHDVADPELVRGAHERLTAQSPVAFAAPLAAAAWESIPSTYLVCADDRSTGAILQREHAARAGRSVELPTGHHPFLSRPDLVADAIAPLLHA